ncbi:unnamed protein product, partial [Mesorhabditis spiculigera]
MARTEHQIRFTRLIFDGDLGETFLHLDDLLREPENGFFLMIECLHAWADAIGNPEKRLMAPLIEALLDSDTEEASIIGLRLFNNMLRGAPSETKRLQLEEELRELHFESHLSQIRLKYAAVPAVVAEVEEFYTIRREQECVRPPRQLTPRPPMQSSAVGNRTGASPPLSSPIPPADEKENNIEDEQNDVLDSLKTALGTDGETLRLRKRLLEKLAEVLSDVHCVSDIEPVLMKYRRMMEKEAPKKAEAPKAFKPPKKSEMKMMKMQWTKIEPHDVKTAEDTLWSRLVNEGNPLAAQVALDYSQLDELFSQQNKVVKKAERTTLASKKTDEVVLLDTKRFMNVSIFIKKLGDVQELIADIRECRGTTKLDSLQLLLTTAMPTLEEVELIRTYSGDSSKLAPPESFFLHLVAIPDYSLRIKLLKFRMDFYASMEKLTPQVKLLCEACNQILTSTALLRVFVLICKIGNYLNDGSASGDAAGFKLNSLWKVIELKANTGQDTLLHFITKNDATCVDELKEQLSCIKDAAKIPSPNEIETEFNELDKQRAQLEKELATKHDTVLLINLEYIQEECKTEMAQLQRLIASLTEFRPKMAQFFMERPNEFKIEECVRMFNNFLVRLEKAHQDNVQREDAARKREQKAKFVAESPIPSRRGSFFPGMENQVPDDLASLLNKTEVLPGRRNSVLPMSRRGSEEGCAPVGNMRRFSVVDRIRERREREEKEQQEQERKRNEGLNVKVIAEDDTETVSSSDSSPRSGDGHGYFGSEAKQQKDTVSTAASKSHLPTTTPEGKEWKAPDLSVLFDSPQKVEKTIPPETTTTPFRGEVKITTKPPEKPKPTGLPPSPTRPAKTEPETLVPTATPATKKTPPNLRIWKRTVTESVFTKPGPAAALEKKKETTPTSPAKKSPPPVATPVRRPPALKKMEPISRPSISKTPSLPPTPTRKTPSSITSTSSVEKKPTVSIKTVSRTPLTPPASKPRIQRLNTSGALLNKTPATPTRTLQPRRQTAPVQPISIVPELSTSARPSLIQRPVPRSPHLKVAALEKWEKPKPLRATGLSNNTVSNDSTEKKTLRPMRPTMSADAGSATRTLSRAPITPRTTPTPKLASNKSNEHAPRPISVTSRAVLQKKPSSPEITPPPSTTVTPGMSSTAKNRLKSLAERRAFI